jgi:cytochrome c biogenesis protein CcmG/thiol:disulfide interchange protein DsbE
MEQEQSGAQGSPRPGDQRALHLSLAIVLAVLLVLAALSFLASKLAPAGGSAEAQPTTVSPELPAPAVDFNVQDLAGESVQLSAYRGEVVLVNFWATWCAPCQEEMALLDTYYHDHRTQGFVLLGVNVSDRPEEAAAFYEEKGYAFPILFDPPGNVLIDLDIRGLPASMLVDREGNLREKWLGPLTPGMLENEVTPLLTIEADE